MASDARFGAANDPDGPEAPDPLSARPGKTRRMRPTPTAAAAAGRGHLVLPKTFAGRRTDWHHRTVDAVARRRPRLALAQVLRRLAGRGGRRWGHQTICSKSLAKRRSQAATNIDPR